MSPIEDLIDEYANLVFCYKTDIPEGLCGFIYDNMVFLDKRIPPNRLYAPVAEEIGHFETACSDIIDPLDIRKRKEEIRGRNWSYKKLIPYDRLRNFIDTNETVYNYHLAEEFGVPEDFIKKAINMYRIGGYFD